jgi:hypothetical protein|tara:strand:- start:314 stop:541 length:228 start_codon:yes stop_codon:yes gene_type:complete
MSKIHKGLHHHNDCDHKEEEYLFSCKTITKSGELIKWDCYMLEDRQLCLRSGDGGDYMSTDLNSLIKSYLRFITE